MGALAVESQWMPEDDLLLKNAVEAGASLESLSKGAVQFSRKFTIKELQERWHSLLYDPVISAEASFRMLEIERSSPSLLPKLNRSGNSKEAYGLSRKRNAKTVRSSYYELRKKMRTELFDPMDLNFFISPASSDPFDLEESHLEIIHSAFPEILADGGFVAPQNVENEYQTGPNEHIVDSLLVQSEYIMNEASCILDENMVLTVIEEMGRQGSGDLNAEPSQIGRTDFEGNHRFNTLISECNPVLDCRESSSELPDASLREGNLRAGDDGKAEIANTSRGDVVPKSNQEQRILQRSSAYTDCYLAELSNSLLKDEEVITDVDGKDMVDKSYFDGLSSLLLNSPNSAEQKHLNDATDPVTCPLDQKDDHGNYGEESADARMFSGGLDSEKHPEIRNGIIWCTLNTEDPEIPCNDDIFIIDHDHQVSVPRQNSSEGSKLTSSTVVNFRARNTVKSIELLPVKPAMHETMPNNTASGHHTESGFHKRDSGNISPRYPYISYGGQSAANNPHLLRTSSDINGEFMKEKPAAGFESDNDIADCELAGGTSVLERDEDLIESDDDIPCSSDIEAMILDMDLEPDEQGKCELQVTRYQPEDIKRAIIRLEQSSHAYMQRAIALHGALAVLYGRYSKHYLKKPRVLLGRTSSDVAVDIDLRQAGCSNKISRRQAIINLEKDGLFRLINLGRKPVLVNDNEVDGGETSLLNSNCLIEIRGLAFIFETNETCVKRYLDSVGEEDESG